MAKEDRFNVTIKRFFGDTPHVCGANLTKKEAETYVADVREAEPGEYAIVPVPANWNKKEEK